jgi:hypothetical protein
LKASLWRGLIFFGSREWKIPHGKRLSEAAIFLGSVALVSGAIGIGLRVLAFSGHHVSSGPGAESGPKTISEFVFRAGRSSNLIEAGTHQCPRGQG